VASGVIFLVPAVFPTETVAVGFNNTKTKTPIAGFRAIVTG
jgi:putative heme iron utilization protein